MGGSYFPPWIRGLKMGPMTTRLSSRSATLLPTPSQVPGPFYPGDEAFSLVRDLTRVPGAPRRALGQEIFLLGDVRDETGQSVRGARVRLWQACASGRYDDPRDTNPSPRDPFFAYRGMCETGDDGRFEFLTVRPGEYKDTETWTRPPHLHFRVTAPGFEELVTQMYFAGNALNEKDLILENTPRAEWDRLVVKFAPFGKGVLSGEFRIVLARA